MASFKTDILAFVSRIEKTLVEINDKATMMSKDIDAVKQLIKSETAEPETRNSQIESLHNSVDGSACSQVIESRKNAQMVVSDHNVDDSSVDIGNDGFGSDKSCEVEGIDQSLSITQHSNEVETVYLSVKSVEDLKQMIQLAREKYENSVKKLDETNELFRKVRQQNGPGMSKESNEKAISKLKINMSVHSSIVKKMSAKIEELKKELRSRKLAKMKPVETFVTYPAVTASGSSSASEPLKRKLNESVVDCGVLRKISKKEEESIVIRKLKKEENPCDDSFVCSFCQKSFGSAGPLTAHLERHYSGNKNQRLDCPWPNCGFANTRPNLTKHMRSKHTKEELFECTLCHKKFHTMDMKVIHEKKHRQQDVWNHCRTCKRFYKVARGGCSFCQK